MLTNCINNWKFCENQNKKEKNRSRSRQRSSAFSEACLSMQKNSDKQIKIKRCHQISVYWAWSLGLGHIL